MTMAYLSGILELSIRGSVLIVAAIILRALFISKLPKSAFILMWITAIAALLIPVNLTKIGSTADMSGKRYGVILPDSGYRTESEDKYAVTENIADEKTEDMTGEALFALWAVGAAACSGYFIFSCIKCRRAFSFAERADSEFISDWKNCHRLKRTVEVKISSHIGTPLTYGIIRPVILLPKNLDLKNEKQLRFILLHEFIHIRNFDGLIKGAASAALCIHWFNPLAWALHRLLSFDLELRCDEKVLRELGIDLRAEYARTLISLEEQRSGFLPVGSGFLGECSAKERIVEIMKFSKKSVLASCVAIVLFASAAIGAYAISAKSKTDKNNAGTNPDDYSFSVGYDKVDPEFDREDFESGVDYTLYSSENGEPVYIPLKKISSYIAENGCERYSYAAENIAVAGKAIFTDEDGNPFSADFGGFDSFSLKIKRSEDSVSVAGETLGYLDESENVIRSATDANYSSPTSLEAVAMYGLTNEFDRDCDFNVFIETESIIKYDKIELYNSHAIYGNSIKEYTLGGETVDASEQWNADSAPSFEVDINDLDGLSFGGLTAIITGDELDGLSAGDTVSLDINLDFSEEDDIRWEICVIAKNDDGSFDINDGSDCVDFSRNEDIVSEITIPEDGSYAIGIRNVGRSRITVASGTVSVKK